MKPGILFLGAVLLLTACDKDKFQTKPQIEIKSAGPDVVPIGGTLSLRMQFTDKEGDVEDSMFVIRKRLNQRDLFAEPTTLRYKIPPFPDKSKGEIDVQLAWATALTLRNPAIKVPGEERNEPDTLLYKFLVRDAEGNSSDTVTLNKNIIVIR